MAYIEDRWHRKDRTRTDRYGKGQRWRVAYEDASGKTVRESCDTRDEAEVLMAERISEVSQGTYVPAAARGVTFGELWPRFETIKSTKAEKTREMYAGAWHLYIQEKWAGTAVRDLRSPAVGEWLAGLKTTRGKNPRAISASYEHKILLVLKSLCNLAVNDGVVPRSPLEGMKSRAQPPSSRRYLNVLQADALLAEIAPNDLMVEIMLHTGVRRGEAAGFKVADLNIRRGRLRVERDIDDSGEDDPTKSGRHRDVPVSGELLDRLVEVAKTKKPGDYLMTDIKGLPWTKHTWRYVWDKARYVTGYHDLDSHELRHTAVSWAIHAGANIKTIQRMVGHASAAMTLDVYGHLWDDELDEVSRKVYKHLEEERRELRKALEKGEPVCLPEKPLPTDPPKGNKTKQTKAKVGAAT